MNKEIINEISKELQIPIKGIEAVLHLLEEGNTIPFIARYRKEQTGSLDEEQIRRIHEYYAYEVNLLSRKEDVIRLIEEKDLMTDELKEKILASKKLVEVEDLYRPYKEKKKTKATDAIANGLEPLAKKIMSFPENGDLEILSKPYCNEKVPTYKEAILGAQYIIAEWTSDNAYFRKWIRSYTFQNGSFLVKKKKGAVDEEKVYEMYYDFKESVKYAKSYRILAMNRGEKEKILSVSLEVDEDSILKFLEEKIIKDDHSFVKECVKEAIKDSYKRLISPSIEREIRAELTEKAEEIAIDNFSKNLEKLLLTPPMKDKMVLGLDPAYRTGCKLAVIDPTGKKLAIKVIYPHEPHKKYEEAKKIVLELMEQYSIDIVAIGNGTASRESELFIADVIKSQNRKISYILVSEAGASVYSASKLAIEEFPDLHVEERSAISIGRRLQDPLAELVKIDPESIGVGLYQHDVARKRLSESLDFVVSKAVNAVGVNINTASAFLLKYVSGLTKKSIDKILEYRNTHGRIASRAELFKQKILSDKAYEQAIGFLRVMDGSNPLDETAIHPESYKIALQILDDFEMKEEHIGSLELIEKLKGISKKEYAQKLKTDLYTLEDIISSLEKPKRDPRDEMPKPILKQDVLHLEDLQVGMKLQGTVRNVAPFGVFIDIGLKNDGLAHISKLSNQFIKDPMDVVQVGDIVDCYVEEIHLDKNKVSLSLVEGK